MKTKYKEKEDIIANKILKKYLNIYKINAENHMLKAMNEYAKEYHKILLVNKKQEDIKLILDYYHNKYKETGHIRNDTASQTILSYILNGTKTENLLKKLKQERDRK